jgi:hypothetical protein
MIDTPDNTGENVEVVERFLAAFDVGRRRTSLPS